MEWLIIAFLLLTLIGLGIFTYGLFQREKLAYEQVKVLSNTLKVVVPPPPSPAPIPDPVVSAPIVAIPAPEPVAVIPISAPTTIQEPPINKILADGAYDVLLVVDATYHVLSANDSAHALFDKNPLIGIPLSEIGNLPELELMVNDALVNEEESFEEQMLFKERHYRVRTQVYRHEGKPYIRLAMSDITQLVKLNRARRDMVANISHELRTPIANIRLIIDNLFHDQDKPKRKESISSLRNIARETENLIWLVQEMSDLSMIESGQSIVRMVENNLHGMVDDAIERLGQRIEVNNIQVVNTVPEHFLVLCDRDLIQRVLVNLVHNATKWSPQGETVTVYAENGGDEVTIRVFDNGPGVPPDQVDRIFERFYQVDAARSGGEGTGLGLAICRHIVEAHGGKIWAEANTGGTGGRFFFTLLSAEEE
ncbi:MAG TPA: HAMP domain-containing sensor histidine kinase [Aggregatilineales bacterium]|nr:HAMP domain-containing sensor histidine kinase [Aggregatilineales bacterium]